MSTVRRKRLRLTGLVLALGIALACLRTVSAAEPSETDMYQSWRTISVEELKLACETGVAVQDGRYRLIGEVKPAEPPNPSLGSYYFIQGSEGGRFPVRITGNRPMAGDTVFLTATLQTADGGMPYLKEAYVWRFHQPAGFPGEKHTTPTTENLRAWLLNGGYEYAVENAFRRFFVKARDGEYLPEIRIGEWEGRGKRTTVTEIDCFLRTHLQPRPGSRWTVLASFAAVLALGAGIATLRARSKRRALSRDGLERAKGIGGKDGAQ